MAGSMCGPSVTTSFGPEHSTSLPAGASNPPAQTPSPSAVLPRVERPAVFEAAVVSMANVTAVLERNEVATDPARISSMSRARWTLTVF